MDGSRARGEEVSILRSKPYLREILKVPVGYSADSRDASRDLLAVALGARVIEKHVTLDKNQPGPDHQASASVEEFSQLVSSIRRMELALGVNEKIFSGPEESVRSMARKSVVAARNIKAGETIGEEDIVFKRPGTGISPARKESVVGRKAARDLEADRIIMVGDVK